MKKAKSFQIYNYKIKKKKSIRSKKKKKWNKKKVCSFLITNLELRNVLILMNFNKFKT